MAMTFGQRWEILNAVGARKWQARTASPRIAHRRSAMRSDAQLEPRSGGEPPTNPNKRKMMKGNSIKTCNVVTPQKLIVGSTCESGESMASHSSSVTDESVTSLTTHAHECCNVNVWSFCLIKAQSDLHIIREYRY